MSIFWRTIILLWNKIKRYFSKTDQNNPDSMVAVYMDSLRKNIKDLASLKDENETNCNNQHRNLQLKLESLNNAEEALRVASKQQNQNVGTQLLEQCISLDSEVLELDRQLQESNKQKNIYVQVLAALETKLNQMESQKNTIIAKITLNKEILEIHKTLNDNSQNDNVLYQMSHYANELEAEVSLNSSGTNSVDEYMKYYAESKFQHLSGIEDTKYSTATPAVTADPQPGRLAYKA